MFASVPLGAAAAGAKMFACAQIGEKLRFLDVKNGPFKNKKTFI